MTVSGTVTLDRITPASTNVCDHDRALTRLAAEILEERSKRLKLFDQDFFGEPAWVMLLDLYISNSSFKRQSTTSLCFGAGTPATTALRWLSTLERRGLVSREMDPYDRRRTLVDLTMTGKALVSAYLRDVQKGRRDRDTAP